MEKAQLQAIDKSTGKEKNPKLKKVFQENIFSPLFTLI